MTKKLINMYSDTVTKPTPGMLQAIVEADVGDDMSGDDPTVNRLESMIADLLEKEAAVYACSGTQSNQMGVRTHCIPGDELLIDETGHIANFEGGAPAALSGVSTRTIRGRNGMLDSTDLEGKVRADNQHLCNTKLVCVENTTNGGGGRAYPVDQLHRVGQWAQEHGLRVHLDGARLFNASIASGASVAEICRYCDTVSICFSKGLGCPMGSVLVGSAEQITRARRIRKLFGGALRQAGIVASTAIYALENNVNRLADDHANAREFAKAISDIDGISINVDDVQSNLVFFQLDSKLGYSSQLSAKLLEYGVKIGAMGPRTMRACTHLDVSLEDVLQAARTLRECVSDGIEDFQATTLGPFVRA